LPDNTASYINVTSVSSPRTEGFATSHFLLHPLTFHIKKEAHFCKFATLISGLILNFSV